MEQNEYPITIVRGQRAEAILKGMGELVELAKRCELQQDGTSDNMRRIWSQGTEHSAWETMAAYARRLARIAYDYAVATKITNDNDNEDDEDNQDWPL